jgi:LacI family transcriptional regulator, galactose operon repressor
MVTQELIAKKLGVSRQLVSFALAGYPKISDTSRTRILAVARKMGYRPNPHARALKRSHTGIVALWVPDQISSHYMHVAREMGRLVKQARHELIISEVGSLKAEQTLSHVPVDGIFAVDAAEQVWMHLKSPDAAVPVISIGAEFCDRTDFVRVDLGAGARAVMRHLIGAGYRRIAHATFMHPSHPYAGRRTGYTEAMREAGLKPEFFIYPLSDQQRAIVRRAIQDYIRRRGKPDAVFCHSDDVAVAIYRGLRDLKLRVPDDVALVGCDGIQDTEYLECPITTLVQPVAEMCATAWKFLENRLKHPAMKQQRATLKPVLTLRESSQNGKPLIPESK